MGSISSRIQAVYVNRRSFFTEDRCAFKKCPSPPKKITVFSYERLAKVKKFLLLFRTALCTTSTYAPSSPLLFSSSSLSWAPNKLFSLLLLPETGRRFGPSLFLSRESEMRIRRCRKDGQTEKLPATNERTIRLKRPVENTAVEKGGERAERTLH